MVQAAGGNTSIKEGDTMWIKSSGKWLIDARSSELMVPVSISQIKDALKDNSCSYDEILKTIENNWVDPVIVEDDHLGICKGIANLINRKR